MSSTKPLIVAIHGTASSGSMWKPLKRACAGSYDLQALDVPGYCGNADLLFEPNEDLVSKVASLIDFRRSNVHLVGHSFGGTSAHAIADGYGNDGNDLIIAGGGFDYI
ncbi:alpha/beta hydrolase [Ruegeria sp. 2205SS24-7]|uniref:alpha/beta fold hydrolase n=1 Tax=Ruegeria discodermiae TaxID=3064389 RepID=UPI0027418FF6|nr:alpha/beta hydrolase [Ruegeria sp. 2205SS24-7]MDP5219788.1 alpha/beta hydrolase [Ruegeria sp. 2205SS24-7]